MNTLKLIINILEYILAGYLGITVIYNLIYAYFLFAESTIIVFLKAMRWVKRKG